MTYVKVDESHLIKPEDIKSLADFWLAVESGELQRTIAWKMRKEDNPRIVHDTAVKELFRYVQGLKSQSGKKQYGISRKDIESFSKKFEKYYTEFHYLHRVEDKMSSSLQDGPDEDKFDAMNEYLWNKMFKACDTNVGDSFKQWMVNQKRMMLGLQVQYPILFGLWSPTGGNGKSFLLECLARALSAGNLFVLNQWADLESTSGSYLREVFGVLYKDEIGTTKGIKDTIKSLITSSEITIQCKYKEPIKLPKRFQLVCSANKPIGSRVFEDESGYQRRDGTHECWGRLFDVERQEDLIRFFRKMYEYAPHEFRMDRMPTREFEYDEDTVDLLKKISSSPLMIDTKRTNASKAVKMASFSNICKELEVDSKNRDVRFYKLEALLEKSGCFERIKYGKVSTRFFKPIPDKLLDALKDVTLTGKSHDSIRQYVKPTVTKNYAQMMDDVFGSKRTEKTYDKKKDEALPTKAVLGEIEELAKAKDAGEDNGQEFGKDQQRIYRDIEKQRIKADMSAEELVDEVMSDDQNVQQDISKL